MTVATSWKEVTLEDHVDLVVGYAFKSSGYTDDESDVRLLRGDNVAQGELRWDKAKRWPIADYQRYEAFHLREGDIVLAMDRPWISAGLKYARIKRKDIPALLVQRVARLRGTESLKTDYLRCVIGSADFTNYVLSILTGVNIPHISAKDIKKFSFLLPPVEIQERISKVITSYDDLIENNRRRIEILEEVARRLYEEWFVQFRFPGYEGKEFKESELGQIPESWDIQPLYDVAEVTYGHPFRASQFNEDGVGLGIVRIRDIKAGEVKTYTPEEGKPKHLIENGDILIGMDGQFHMGKWAGGQAWLVQRVARFRPIQIGRYFLFLSLERPIKHLENTIVGTTVAHLSAKDLQKLHVVMPEKAVLDAASAFLEPIYNLEMKLRRKNANLRAQRDLLLPKLISGEIDVSDIPMPT